LSAFARSGEFAVPLPLVVEFWSLVVLLPVEFWPLEVAVPELEEPPLVCAMAKAPASTTIVRIFHKAFIGLPLYPLVSVLRLQH